MNLTRLIKPLFILSAAAASGGGLAADPQVDLKTSAGTIRIELYPAKAPKSGVAGRVGNPATPEAVPRKGQAG